MVRERGPRPSPRIVEAVSRQVAELDYAPPFQMGHPKAFELANKVAELLPPSHRHIFFVNSGSEGVDTALKIALAYHRAKSEGARQRLIGRERGYHGVGFGGISVGRDGQQPEGLRFPARGCRSSSPHARPRAKCFH